MALLLAIVVIGLIIFIYLLVVKPEGTLTVVYALRDSQAAGPASPQAQNTPAAALSDRLSQVQAAREAGLITDDEYEARRKRILDEV